MGWDCFAFGPQGGDIKDKKVKDAFRSAIRCVLRKCEYHDIHVSSNFVVLDVSDTGRMITKAGVNAWDAGKIKRVRDLKFDWDFPYTKEQAPYYWSARKFMEVCAKYDLTIKSSW